MTPEDLAALIEAVRTGVETAQPLPPKLLFNQQEAAAITGLPESFFEREAPIGHIPSHAIETSPGSGRYYRRYSLAQLQQIADAYEVKPTSGPMAQRGRGLRAVR
jgi:hypothetical protein